MAKTRSMTRNQNHDDGASVSRKSPNSCAPWSDLDHYLLRLVMMQLGFCDYYSFRGVCKSLRLLACSNENMVMASMPPMSISICSDAHEKACYLEEFEGSNFKTFLSHSAVGGVCVGLTCGYLIFYTKATHDFWLVNPITRKELYFPDFPITYKPDILSGRVILVFSSSKSEWVFVVLNAYSTEIWFSTEGKGEWDHVSQGFSISDLYAFKGKIYTLSYISCYPLHERFCLCELRLGPQPELTILEIKKPVLFYPTLFVSSGESLYGMSNLSEDLNGLHELDLGERKWVPCEKRIEEYAFFRSNLNHVGVAVKRELWADPRSRSHGRYASFPNTDYNGNIIFFDAHMWYFPYECMNVDRID